MWPETSKQRWWNRKTTNLLDRLPRRERASARACEAFRRRYADTQPDAVAVVRNDSERMTASHDFPEKHWRHLRRTNVVESPFALVRLRTKAAKWFKRVDSATALIRRLLMMAEKRFWKLNAPELLRDVYEGRRFEDGKPIPEGRRRVVA